MTTSYRGAVLCRQYSSSSSSLAYAQRDHRGDTGPSSRKAEELRVRSSIRSGKGGATVNDRSVLDGFLIASSYEAPRQQSFGITPPQIIPSRSPPRPRGSTGSYGFPQPRPRFDAISKGFYTPRPLPPTTSIGPNPYDTSRQLREWIKAHPPPITNRRLKEVVGIVQGAEKGAVNAVVWNTLLGLVGREFSLKKMWRLYNAMKKNGIEPNARTYTTLINAYAGANHAEDLPRFVVLPPLEPLTQQRITSIYNQSQAHISECVEALERRKQAPDLGLAGEENLVEEEEDAEAEGDEMEISLGPTNAYLKFLGRYGRFEQMDRIYLAMDNEGPLAPDNITYSTMFSSLLNREQQQRNGPVNSSRPSEARSGVPKPFEIGPVARSMWEHAVRQMHPSNRSPSDKSPRVDTEMALLAMQCLILGRPADQQLAIALMPFLWHLPPPGSVVVASSTPRSENTEARILSPELPAFMRSLPRLPLDNRAAKTILSVFNRESFPTLAAHYAEHLLSNRAQLNVIDWGVLQTIIHALSNVGKVDRIIDILDTFQPPTGPDGWPAHVWANALTATRWSGKFQSALNIFRRMTHLPPGFEDGQPVRTKWTSPNDKPVDIQGRQWIKPLPLAPDAKCMSLFIKTAVGSNNLHSARQAWTIFSHYPLATLFTVPEGKTRDRKVNLLPPFSNDPPSPGLLRVLQWRVTLAKDVESLAEKVLDGVMAGEEVRRVNEIRRMMGEVARYWGDRAIGQHAVITTSPMPSESEEYDEGRERASG